MKKSMALVFSSLLAVSVLSGCGNDKETAKSAGDKVKIEFFQYKPEAGATFDKLIQKFEQENPNIDVVQANTPDATTVLKTRVSKQDTPDIVGMGADIVFADLAKAGVFADLTDAPQLKNIQPSYVKMLHDVTGLKQTYGIPYAANADGVIYNKALFKELGLTVPATWDEFMAVNEKIKSSGKVAFYWTLKDSWTSLPSFNALAANTQGDTFFEDRRAGKTTFQQGYKEAAEKYLKLLEYGHKDNFGKGYADGNVAFAKGESVMYLQGIWAIPEIKKANPTIELGVFPYPVTNGPSKNKLVSGVDLLLSLSKTSKHPEEAKKFIDFLLKEENAKAYISEQNSFSAVVGVMQEDASVKELNEVFKKGMMVDFPDHSVPSSMKLDKVLQEFSQKKDVSVLLKTLDTEWDKVAERK